MASHEIVELKILEGQVHRLDMVEGVALLLLVSTRGPRTGKRRDSSGNAFETPILLNGTKVTAKPLKKLW